MPQQHNQSLVSECWDSRSVFRPHASQTSSASCHRLTSRRLELRTPPLRISSKRTSVSLSVLVLPPDTPTVSPLRFNSLYYTPPPPPPHSVQLISSHINRSDCRWRVRQFSSLHHVSLWTCVWSVFRSESATCRWSCTRCLLSSRCFGSSTERLSLLTIWASAMDSLSQNWVN